MRFTRRGQLASRVTCSAIEPKNQREAPVRPCVVIADEVDLLLLGERDDVSAGAPNDATLRTVTPANRSSKGARIFQRVLLRHIGPDATQGSSCT